MNCKLEKRLNNRPVSGSPTPPRTVIHRTPRTPRTQHRGTLRLRFITMKGLKTKSAEGKIHRDAQETRHELLEPSPKGITRTHLSPSSKELWQHALVKCPSRGPAETQSPGLSPPLVSSVQHVSQLQSPKEKQLWTKAQGPFPSSGGRHCPSMQAALEWVSNAFRTLLPKTLSGLSLKTAQGWEVVQLVKRLLCRHEELSLTPSTYIKSGQSSACLGLQYWGKRQGTRGYGQGNAAWLTSQAQWEACLKNKAEARCGGLYI